MTKKPSEKNKAWEKDRRDRLNKSFENLSKLLPNYDPSTIWTKNEIIQKSILHIEDVHEKYEKCLSDKDPGTFSLYKGLKEAINYFQCRNKQISDILKDKKINLPALNLPKFLIDYPHFNTERDIEKNHSNNSKEKLKKEKDLTCSNCKNKTNKLSSQYTKQKNTTKDEETNQTDQPIIQSPHQQCVNFNNESIILPVQKPLTPNLIQIANSTAPLVLHKNKNGKIYLLSKPEIKLYFSRSDGKIPIPVIKKYVPIKSQFKKINKSRKTKQNLENKNRKRKISEIKKISIVNSNEQLCLEKSISRSLSPTAAFLQSFPVVAQKSTDNDILCDITSNTVNDILKSTDKSFHDTTKIDKKNETDIKTKTAYSNNAISDNVITESPIKNAGPMLKSFFRSSYSTSSNVTKTSKLLNLSTQKPICTPLPLDNKGDDVPNVKKPDPLLFNKLSNVENNQSKIYSEDTIKLDDSAKKLNLSYKNLNHKTYPMNVPNNSVIYYNQNTLIQNNQYITNNLTPTPININNSELCTNIENSLAVDKTMTQIYCGKKISSTKNENMNFDIQNKLHIENSESNKNIAKVTEKYIATDPTNSNDKFQGEQHKINSNYLQCANNSINRHPNYFDNNSHLALNVNSYKLGTEEKPTYISYSNILNSFEENNLKTSISKKIPISNSNLYIKSYDMKENENNNLIRNSFQGTEKYQSGTKYSEPLSKINKMSTSVKPQDSNPPNSEVFPNLNSLPINGTLENSDTTTNTINKIYSQEKRSTNILNSKYMIDEPKLNSTPIEMKSDYLINSNVTNKKYDRETTATTSRTSYPITNSTANEAESMFSKNYYYHPVPVQPETTFSFSLNTSQQNYFHTSKNLFTFSLTPTTNTFLPNKLNEPLQNYTDLINQNCQSSATNFTFSLTTPISSITQSEKLDSIHTNVISENCPKYFDQQFYQNNATTNFTFALTKTTETISTHEVKGGNKIENKTEMNLQIKDGTLYSNSNQLYYNMSQESSKIKHHHSHDIQKPYDNWINPTDCNKKVPNTTDQVNKNSKTNKPLSQNLFSVSQLVHDCENFQSSDNISSQENKKNALIRGKTSNIPADSFAEQKFYNYSAESLISKKEKHKITAVPNCNIGSDYYPQNSFNYNIDENYSNNYLVHNQEDYSNVYTKSNKCLLNKKSQQVNFHQPLYDSGNYIPPPPPPTLSSDFYSHNYYSNNNLSNFNNNWNPNEVNNSTGNLTNFYLSSICPEINEKHNTNSNW